MRIIFIFSIVVLASCTNSAPPQASPARKTAARTAHASVPQAGTALAGSQELKGEIGLLMITASAENRMREMRLKLVLLGGGKDRLTEADLIRMAYAKDREVGRQYRDILDKLPAGELRDALKQDAVAESRYLRLYGGDIDSIGWETQLAAAKADIDSTRSRLQFEIDEIN